jgi:hypothetical protein
MLKDKQTSRLTSNVSDRTVRPANIATGTPNLPGARAYCAVKPWTMNPAPKTKRATTVSGIALPKGVSIAGFGTPPRPRSTINRVPATPNATSPMTIRSILSDRGF